MAPCTLPTLYLDIKKIKQNYISFTEAFENVKVFYAVKANPHPQILRELVRLGSNFDAASINEIRQCLDAGALPSNISFGNTIKGRASISKAYHYGITLFAADSHQELEKIAKFAPNSRVYIRVIAKNDKADWALGKKFGCSTELALELLYHAKNLSLNPIGLSFHVGSQTRHPYMWYSTIDEVAELWDTAISKGIKLDTLNIGGGFPIEYHDPITGQKQYAKSLLDKINSKFSGVKTVMSEPGRAIAATAGYIQATVELVADKGIGDHRWVYLDIGRFTGLAETESEAIKYRISVIGKFGAPELFKLAGPTCDSADILYEKNLVSLPSDISYEDTVIIHDCGAYTSTYSTIGFNGFDPLRVVVI